MKIPLIFALLGAICGASLAQTDGVAPPAPLQQPPTRTYQIQLKNVKPSIMVWWLDPDNHRDLPIPAPPRPRGIQGGLPAGVEKIIAVDPQNALVVFATAEGATQMMNIINVLDKPLQQVEISARFFQIDSDEIGKLGIYFSATPAQPQFSRVTGNIDTLLETLQGRKKAILLTAPRLTTFNNSTAELKYTYAIPATWDVTVTRPKGTGNLFSDQENLSKLPQGTVLAVVNSQSLQVTPTLNNDDTITLVAMGEQKLELQGDQKTDGAIVLQRQQSPKLLVNVRDGETIAVEEQALPDKGRASASKTIVLLTTRIVRRAGE